jgi:hypothetical protein
MATKKKASKQVDKLAFNKKNTLALADRIYSEKGGVITALKLCHGTLANGKEGGRTTHCAVGEAYFTFVNPNLGNVNRAEDPTNAAVEALMKVAQLKKDTDGNREKLRVALDEAVNENDSGDENEGAAEYAARSARVAECFRKEVAPLLK